MADDVHFAIRRAFAGRSSSSEKRKVQIVGQRVRIARALGLMIPRPFLHPLKY